MVQGLVLPETAQEILSHQITSDEYILGSWLEVGTPVLIAGAPGCGKSWFAYWMGYSIANGIGCFNWTIQRPRKVAILDGEMRLSTIKKRVQVLHTSLGDPAQNFGILARHTFRQNKQIFPDLRNKNDRAELLKCLSGYDVLILDNINSIFPGGNENEPQFWKDIECLIWECQDQRLSPLLVHHTPKSNPGRAAGSSKNERVAEIIITLSKVQTTERQNSVWMNVEFSKCRELAPDAVNFSAKLITVDGVSSWDVSSPAYVTDGKIALIDSARTLREKGLSIGKISKELSVAKSTVQGWVG